MINKVSVIIPTYNNSSSIASTICSVLDQTFADYEIIVIDDGSTDATKEIVLSFSNKVKYFYQTNQGPASARNRGIKESSGEYIAFLDGDDLWLPDKLKKSVDFLEKHRFDWICTDCIRSDMHSYSQEHLKLAENVLDREKRVVDLLKDGIIFLSSLNLFTITVLARKQCFETVGLFDSSIWIGEDHDLWLRFAESGFRLGYLSEPLSIYRVNKGSLTKSHSIDGLKESLKVMNKHARILGLKTRKIRDSYAMFLYDVGAKYYKKKQYRMMLVCFLRSLIVSPIYIQLKFVRKISGILSTNK